MRQVLTRHFELWRDRQFLNWWVEGVDGAVNVQAMRIPDRIMQNDSWGAEEMGFVRTDAGWLMGSDLGYHYRERVYEELSDQPNCPVLKGQCWYDGSSLGAQSAMTLWRKGNFDDEVLYRFCEEVYWEVMT